MGASAIHSSIHPSDVAACPWGESQLQPIAAAIRCEAFGADDGKSQNWHIKTTQHSLARSHIYVFIQMHTERVHVTVAVRFLSDWYLHELRWVRCLHVV